MRESDARYLLTCEPEEVVLRDPTGRLHVERPYLAGVAGPRRRPAPPAWLSSAVRATGATAGPSAGPCTSIPWVRPAPAPTGESGAVRLDDVQAWPGEEADISDLFGPFGTAGGGVDVGMGAQGSVWGGVGHCGNSNVTGASGGFSIGGGASAYSGGQFTFPIKSTGGDDGAHPEALITPASGHVPRRSAAGLGDRDRRSERTSVGSPRR